MTFTPVIPSVYSTDRQDLHDALEAIVEAFIASESYECGRAWRSNLPDTFTAEGPLIVLGDITESVSFTMQTRYTVFSGALFYVDWITDRDQVGERVDRWADRMRDLFEVNRSTVNPAAVLAQDGFLEGEFTQGTVIVTAPSITFEYRIRRGDQGGSPGP